MIKGLRAKLIRSEDMKNGDYKLIKNSPILINKANNGWNLVVEEKDDNKGLDEKAYILSTFQDDASAMVGYEFCLNFLEKSKAADITYYYFGADGRMEAYIYDLKRSICEAHHIIRLVEQWKMGIATAKSCEMILNAVKEEYHLSDESIHLGVITENNDVERRQRDIEEMKKRQNVDEDIPTFMVAQRKADIAQEIKKLQVLQEFEWGFVEKDGKQYRYLIKNFEDAKYVMKICDGGMVDI